MSYFDRRTPVIFVEQESPTDVAESEPVRYLFGPYPSTISAREMDTYLLSLWETASSGDASKRFLHYYQIIEYAAFYYVQDAVMQKVRRVLASPDMPSRLSESTREILDAVSEDRRHEVEKFQTVIQDLVDPQLVWKEIEPSADLFSEDIEFDGGFTLPALLNKGWSLSDFERAWIPKFPDSLRRIRNALVHARESKMVGVLAPTRTNNLRLVPWLAPLSACSSQVMLYRDA
jgi:hypothetical protein